jgi:hypothetical protein
LSNNYSRISAANYAIKYALKPNSKYRYFSPSGNIGGDCTNFISQCLIAGGAAMVYNSHPWWYNSKACSLSWSVANSFYKCITERAKLQLPGLKGIEVLNFRRLELGDLILYEDSKGTIYHSAIITSFNFDTPLVSQHTYNAANVSPIKSKARKMHFIKIEI